MKNRWKDDQTLAAFVTREQEKFRREGRGKIQTSFLTAVRIRNYMHLKLFVSDDIANWYAGKKD